MKPRGKEATGEGHVGKKRGFSDIPTVGWSAEDAGEAKELCCGACHMVTTGAKGWRDRKGETKWEAKGGGAGEWEASCEEGLWDRWWGMRLWDQGNASVRDVKLNRNERKEIPSLPNSSRDRPGWPTGPGPTCVVLPARPTYPWLHIGSLRGPTIFQLLFKLRLGTCILARR